MSESERPEPDAGTGSPSPPATRGAMGKAFQALDNRQYRWLFASNMAFFLAMNAQMLVRSMVTFDLTGSPLDLGIVSFAVAIPMVVASPFGGVLADRVERRRVILTGQAAVIASELAIFTLLVTGNLALWHMVCAAMLMGCIFPFTMPARTAIVVDVVGKQGLQNAMALSMGGMNATRILGPAIAGLLVPWIGLSGALACGIALYGLAFVSLFGVQRSAPAAGGPPRTVGADLAEGFRYMRENRLVLVMMVFGILPMFLAMPFQSLLVVFTEDVWGVGSSGLGVLYAASGVGGLLGSFYVAQLSERRGRLRTMLISAIAFALFLMGFAMSPWFWAALPLVLFANVFSSIFGTLNNSAIQVLIPDQIRGRISSFLMMSFGVTPLGTLPMSAVAERWGAPAAVVTAAGLVILVTLAFFAASPSLRRVDRRLREVLAEERGVGAALPSRRF